MCYLVTHPERATAEPITAVVADRVRELRNSSGLSQAELAAKMVKLGIPWTRLTVVNLEKRSKEARERGGAGGRDAVTVQELLALAAVLGVPPVLLLADPRGASVVPIADGVELGAWEALLWMIGTNTINDGIISRPVRSSTELDLIWCGRWVAEMVLGIENTPVHPRTAIRIPEGTVVHLSDDDRPRPVDDLHRSYLETIAGVLRRIEELGASVPQLGPTVLKRAAELDVTLPAQDGEG